MGVSSVTNGLVYDLGGKERDVFRRGKCLR